MFARFAAAMAAATMLAAPGSAQQQPLLVPLTPEATANPAIWPEPRWPYPADPAIEARIERFLAAMSLEEKIGQLVQADISSVTPDDVRRYHLGSVLNGGNSAPGGDEFAPPAAWLALADRFYDASMDMSDGGQAIPIIWGTDAVHGHSNIVGATLFPHNVGLGAARDPALMRRIAEATAVEIRTTGQEWTFAPTITVPQDLRWGRAYEGYSSDPAIVSAYVGAFIRGLQGEPGGDPILAGPHVLASTKHFLADGGTEGGRDQGDARIGEEALRDIHGAPYVAAIEAGVETVMVSFSSWNGIKMTGNRSLLTDVLKKRMNFGGFLVSDWNAHGQVEGCTNASCPQAANAGLDMYMAPDSWRDLYGSLLAQAGDGRLSMACVDDAVRAILRVKLRSGLFEAGRPSSRALAGDFARLGSAEHRAIAREAVRKSLVLLKNEGSLLPLRPGASILVAGDGADDVGRQSGGWTLTWQGTGVRPEHFPGATSIWGGIDQAVRAAGGRAMLSADGSFTGARPDAAIVVFGETPYAEFQGDIPTLQLKPELRGPLETMRRLRAEGIPVVALMLTGRPLWTNEWLNAADAFVVAWLPGSEGGGVADLLFRGADGRPAHDFQGRLAFPWPATADATGPTLFPLGHGLSYAQGASVPRLSEESGVAAAGEAGLFMERGLPASAWSLEAGDGRSNTRITVTPARAAAGRIEVTATDHGVQEGARRFALSGGPSVVSLGAPNPIDLTRETGGDAKLLVTMRIDAAPQAPVTLGLRSGGTTARVPLPLDGVDEGTWRTIGVPLKCFQAGGADMARVDVPFLLSTEGAFTFSLARVALGTAADVTIGCGG